MTPTMLVCIWYPYECIRYALCILHHVSCMKHYAVKYCTEKIAFCMRQFINDIGWLFLSKMAQWPNVYLFLYASIWVHTLCIMHYAINILHFAWVNSVILVDFRLSTITPHKAQCLIVFFYASIWVHTLCIMQYAICIMQLIFCNMHE